MVVSRCRGIGPPSGVVLGTHFLLAADLGRHPLGNTPPRSTVSDIVSI